MNTEIARLAYEAPRLEVQELLAPAVLAGSQQCADNDGDNDCSADDN